MSNQKKKDTIDHCLELEAKIKPGEYFLAKKIAEDWDNILGLCNSTPAQNLFPLQLELHLLRASQKDITRKEAAQTKQVLDWFEKTVFEITYRGNNILQSILARKKQCEDIFSKKCTK